jgi:LysM repeat protein
MAPRRPSPELLPHRDASIGELAAGDFDDADIGRPPRPVDDGAEIALLPAVYPNGRERGIQGVDPMVLRIALVVIALLVAIPLALVLRNGNEPTIETDVDGVPATVEPSPIEQGAAPTSVDAGAGVGSVDEGTAATSSTGASPTQIPANDEATFAAADPAASAVAPEPDEAQLLESVSVEPIDEPTNNGGIATPATVEEAAERTVPDCSRTYTAGEGDSWYRIADEAGVTPGQLMDQNQATIDTVIFPGSEVCLPPGAAMPSPPTTLAAPKPSPTTAPPTTAAPTTAAPPTTSPLPPSSSPAEVQAMIREIWPDDLEERALEIARRESNFQSGADNGWCCVGVFQLYWTAHRSWLDDYGIHSRNDLKDARKNITAAYGLYQRNGGWGPWGG